MHANAPFACGPIRVLVGTDQPIVAKAVDQALDPPSYLTQVKRSSADVVAALQVWQPTSPSLMWMAQAPPSLTGSTADPRAASRYR